MTVDHCLRYQGSVNSLTIDILLPEPYYWHLTPQDSTLHALTLNEAGTLCLVSLNNVKEGLAYIEAKGGPESHAPLLELKEMTMLKSLSPSLVGAPLRNVDRHGKLLNLRFSLTHHALPLEWNLHDGDEHAIQNLYCRSCHAALLAAAKHFTSVPSPHSSATTLESYTCHPSFESNSALTLPQRLTQALKKDNNRIFYNQQSFYLSNMPHENLDVRCNACHNVLGHTLDHHGCLSTLNRYKVCYDMEKDTIVHLLATQLLESIQYHAQYYFLLQNQLKIWVIATESWIESSKTRHPERVLLVYYQTHVEPASTIDSTGHWTEMTLSNSVESLTTISAFLEQSTAALLGPLLSHDNDHRYHCDGFQLGYLLLPRT